MGGAACVIPADEAEDTLTVSIGIQMYESADDAAKDTQGLLPMALPLSYEDIASMTVDIMYSGTSEYLLTNIPMTLSAGEWVATIPQLPAETALDFAATAFDAEGEEIFSGTTAAVSFASGSTLNTVNIQLASVTDGDDYDVPRIVKILLPSELRSGQKSQVTFAVEGQSGSIIDYEITHPDGGDVPFYPSTGTITLSSFAGQFVSLYEAPQVDEEDAITYEVTITSAENMSLKAEFSISVLPPSADLAFDTQLTVVYNPIINAIQAYRIPETNNVAWDAVVTDDDDPETLEYQWSFLPGEGSATPDPTFTDATAKATTMQGYSEGVHGSVKLEVTDSDGGTTTLQYNLTLAQFPDQVQDDNVVSSYLDITTGNQHSCVLLTGDTVRCWGRSHQGQLGYGNDLSVGDNEHPYEAGDVATSGVLQVAAGYNHTCVLKDLGFVQCWGYNNYGQLGLGHTASIGDGEPINSPNGGAVNLGGGIPTKIAAGNSHTCALMDNGTVRCWGRNDWGQLGYNHTNHLGDDEQVWQEGAVDVGGTVKDIAAGGNHTCAILDNGDVRCWGYNNWGQLGHGAVGHVGDDEAPSSLGPIDLNGPALALDAGNQHTCALLETGFMQCWGRNYGGALGYNSTNSNWYRNTPGPNLDTGAHVSRISLGSYHTCAILGNGQLKCWGYGANYRLGTGGTGNLYSPPASGVDLDGNQPFQVAAGGEHTCVLLNNGSAWCWGHNAYGQGGYPDGGNHITTPPSGGDIQILAP